VSILAGRALRIAGAVWLLQALVTAVLSPIVPWWLSAFAGVIFVGALVRPGWALPALLAVVPWGARVAEVPIRASELVTCAFLAGAWLCPTMPLRLSRDDSRATVLPGALYAVVAVVSWMRLTASNATAAGWAGVLDLGRLLPSDYLVAAGRDPHTAAAVQIVVGVALMLTVAALVEAGHRLPRRIAVVLALGASVAAAATLVAVPVRYWMSGDWNEVIRYFVVTRSRYAFHLTDVNAAGSYFVLGGVLALHEAVQGGRARGWWWVSLVITAAALWICGSRAAMMAAALAAAVFWWGERVVRAGWAWPLWPSRVAGGLAVTLLLALSLSPALVGSATAMSGSASRSLGVREEFLITSSRMISTAPVLGVGVGTYYQRSSEFMPAGIRALYGRENAHNYFMQTTAELGVIGIVVFLWWLGASLRPSWRALDPGGRPTLALAVLVACAAYLLTAVSGHPFLVIEASLPFWIVLGVAASGRFSR